MANDMNVVLLIGRIAAHPEMKYTPSGTAVVSFSLANNIYVGKDHVNFFRCVGFGKTADAISSYCKKGDRVSIRGQLKQTVSDRDGEKKYWYEITVQEIQFLATKGHGVSNTETKPEYETVDNPPEESTDYWKRKNQNQKDEVAPDDDDLPF